jgi:hypothetical protein
MFFDIFLFLAQDYNNIPGITPMVTKSSHKFSILPLWKGIFQICCKISQQSLKALCFDEYAPTVSWIRYSRTVSWPVYPLTNTYTMQVKSDISFFGVWYWWAVLDEDIDHHSRYTKYNLSFHIQLSEMKHQRNVRNSINEM